VVGDHGQVAVALAVGDLVDADPVEPVQAGIVQVISHHAHRDGGHGLPGAAQQPGDGGLVGALGQVGHDVFEVAGEPGCWSGPRHRLGADPAAAPAGQPADLGLQVQSRGAQVQVAPAAGGAVVDRAGGPAARAAQPATPPPQRHHDPGRRELDPGHVGAGDGEHLVECGGGAHASLQRLRLLGSSETYEGRRVRVLYSSPAQPGLLTDQAKKAGSARHQTHRSPRSPRKR
jgi:hypothetical protein